MAYKRGTYRPRAEARAILDRAWEHMEAVPYQVTARWLFYRLLQEGWYHEKGDYKDRFMKVLSPARKRYYQGWRPDTLADDTRVAVERGDGYATVEDWGQAVAAKGSCKLARWEGQQHYVEVWFEAGAMRAQFEYYTQDITLRPFFGHPSIPYKWEMAKALEAAHEMYGLPVVVLYFGDLDDSGETIPNSALPDVEAWCAVPFRWVRCGLNEGDQVRYSIPEDPEKPGTYQWEALDDTQAGALIRESVARFVDYGVMTQIAERERGATVAFREYVRRFVADRAWED